MNRPLLAIFSSAVCAWLAFWALLLNTSPTTGIAEIVEHLFLWDSHIFQSIAENGYRHELDMKDPQRNWQTNNIAYPPLYPLLARLTHSLLDVSWIQAFVLVANAACLTTLTLLLLIARKLGARDVWLLFIVLVFAVFPGSIWLLAGYSDAPSMALAFAIIYTALGCLEKPSTQRAIVLLLLGVLLGLTHFRTSVLSGAGVLIGLSAWLNGGLRGKSRQELRRLGIVLCLPVAGAALAMLGFFLYCELTFGHWDAYQQTIFGVWGPSTPYFRQILELDIYSWFDVSLDQDYFGQSTPFLGRFLATWFLTVSCLFLIFEVFFSTSQTARERGLGCSPGLWALLLSLSMQYFLITMRVPSLNNFLAYPMPSVRYLIPCALLLGLYLALLIPEILRRHDASQGTIRATGLGLCAALLLTGFSVQQQVITLFLSGVLQG